MHLMDQEYYVPVHDYCKELLGVWNELDKLHDLIQSLQFDVNQVLRHLNNLNNPTNPTNLTNQKYVPHLERKLALQIKMSHKAARTIQRAWRQYVRAHM